MKPITEVEVTKAVEGHQVAITTTAQGVRLTTWTVHEMEVLKGDLTKTGIFYTLGPFWNIVYCTGIKEE